MNDDTATPIDSADGPSDSKALKISIRAWISLILVCTVCAMSLLQLPVTEPLYSMALLAIGFYFGQKITKP